MQAANVRISSGDKEVQCMTGFGTDMTRCSVSKQGRLEEESGRKSRPNFALFDPPPVKIRGETAKVLSARII